MKNGEKLRKMRKNWKPEAAKARSGSRRPPAETENRKPETTEARSGSRDPQPKPETGNQKPEAEM